MARRRRKKFPLVPLVLLLLLAGAGYAAWRFGPAWLAQWRSGTGGNATTGVTLPGSAALDVCALVPRDRMATLLGVDELQARHVGAGADVPAAGACTWNFRHQGRDGSLVALVFTPASLAAGGQKVHGKAYFDSTVTGMEYALKDIPEPLRGVGDEAAAAGFAGDGAAAQIVVRRGDVVLDVATRGVGRDAAQRVAGALVQGL